VESRRVKKKLVGEVVPTGVVVGVVVLLVLAAGAVGVKLFADSAAATEVAERAGEVADLLEGTSPLDFLAFNAGRRTPGSVAAVVADQPDFVSVDARAERAVIRFRPSGWWQGFTERCVVAVVSDAGVIVEEPKVACVRVDPAGY